MAFPVSNFPMMRVQLGIVKLMLESAVPSARLIQR